VSWHTALRLVSQRSDCSARLRVGIIVPSRLSTGPSGLTLFLATGYNRGFCGSVT